MLRMIMGLVLRFRIPFHSAVNLLSTFFTLEEAIKRLCIQKSHRGVPIKKASASLGHPNPRGFQVVFLDGRAAQVLCHYLIDYKQCWLLPCFVLPSQFSLPARNNQRKGHCSDSNDIELDFRSRKKHTAGGDPHRPGCCDLFSISLESVARAGVRRDVCVASRLKVPT